MKAMEILVAAEELASLEMEFNLAVRRGDFATVEIVPQLQKELWESYPDANEDEVIEIIERGVTLADVTMCQFGKGI